MDGARPVIFVEVTADGILHVGFQFFKVFTLGMDGMPQRAGLIPALRGLLYVKDDFANLSHLMLGCPKRLPFHKIEVRIVFRQSPDQVYDHSFYVSHYFTTN